MSRRFYESSFARAFGLVMVTAALVLSPTAQAAQVEEVVSDLGIRAYLVREPSIPLISVSIQFKGGAAADPEGKQGLAYMLSGLLDEGAGSYDSQAFRRELEDNAIKLSFDADRDSFSGSLTTLSDTRDHAFELLRLALSEPRFDTEPVERIRSQIVSSLSRRENDPDYVSARAFFETAFPDHAYGRPTRGSVETIASLTAEDFRQFVSERLALDNLIIGVAGDIETAALKTLLDETFGHLPATSVPVEIADVEPVVGATTVIDMDIPQSVVTFGTKGLERKHPDYYAAYVANYILGGGGFGSWLMEEVREKRGLAYSVYSYLYQTDHSPMMMGGVSTRNDQVAQSISIIREQIAKMARGEVTLEQLDNAKTYLTGSFPLRLTSNSSIARILVGMQVEQLGVDFLEERNGFVDAVTLEDVQRAAALVFTNPLLVSVVGKPVGLDG